MDNKITKSGVGGDYSILMPNVKICMGFVSRVTFLVGPILPTLKKKAATGGLSEFSAVLQNTNPDKLDSLLMDCMKACKLSFNDVYLDEIQFELHFQIKENKRNLYPTLFWILRECVQDFFPDWTAFVQKFKQKFQKEFTQTESVKPGEKVKPSRKVGQ